jgi:hypothetical protein
VDEEFVTGCVQYVMSGLPEAHSFSREHVLRALQTHHYDPDIALAALLQQLQQVLPAAEYCMLP